MSTFDSVRAWDITGGVARPLVVEPGSSLDKAWDGDDTFALEFADTEPVVVDLDRQVFVVDGEEYEIYGTSAALGILGRALGVPEDAWKTVTIPKSPPTDAPADSKEQP